VDVAIQLEGQSGMTWDRWRRLVPMIEDLGFSAIYRSDHFVNPQGPDLDSLDAWTSMTWLADHTSRVKFGPLVSPVSFRDPVMLARSAASLAELSNGRLILGIGAGWSQREHDMYGYDLLEVAERIDRLAEAIDIVSALLGDAGPLTFDGAYYRLREAQLLPTVPAAHRPPLLIAARGTKRMLPLVAAKADIWNVHLVDRGQFKEMNDLLDRMTEDAGRQPADLQRTAMLGVEVGRTGDEVRRKLAEKSWAAPWRDHGLISGTPGEIRAQFAEWEKAGADELMLQWLDVDDQAGLELLASALP
jgi:alkanesulfonate monooxygenase SsuD/methylene tetrahydromethanopterin reductase-like flavin-dependent oxidoreductase (luciferase family)